MNALLLASDIAGNKGNPASHTRIYGSSFEAAPPGAVHPGLAAGGEAKPTMDRGQPGTAAARRRP